MLALFALLTGCAQSCDVTAPQARKQVGNVTSQETALYRLGLPKLEIFTPIFVAPIAQGPENRFWKGRFSTEADSSRRLPAARLSPRALRSGFELSDTNNPCDLTRRLLRFSRVVFSADSKEAIWFATVDTTQSTDVYLFSARSANGRWSLERFENAASALIDDRCGM